MRAGISPSDAQFDLDLAQDMYQADSAALWFEQVSDALDHLWQGLSDRVRLGVLSSPLMSREWDEPERCKLVRASFGTARSHNCKPA